MEEKIKKYQKKPDEIKNGCQIRAESALFTKKNRTPVYKKNVHNVHLNVLNVSCKTYKTYITAWTKNINKVCLFYKYVRQYVIKNVHWYDGTVPKV